MKMPNTPSHLEMQVLSILWQRGPSTVREVLPAMPDGKQRAYTTILSVMQGMERKGLIDHSTSGKTHVYRATVSRRRVLGPMLRRMVTNIFGGSPTLAVQQLVKESDLSADDLAEIKRIIDDTSPKRMKKGAQ